MAKKFKFVFYTGTPHSGVTFLFSVLNKNPNICTLMLDNAFFEYLSYIKTGEYDRRIGIKIYYKLLEDVTKNIGIDFDKKKVIKIIEKIYVYISNSKEFISYFKRMISTINELRIENIIECIFISKMFAEGKKIDDSIDPVFIFDPHSHINAVLKHMGLIDLLEDVSFLTSVRNPIYTIASSIKSGYYTDKSIAYNLMKSSVLEFVQKLPDRYKDKYFVTIFENEKLNPENTFKLICEFYGIPYVSEMLKANDEGPTCRGYAIRGFDTEPVTRSLSDIFSNEDLNCLYDIFRKFLEFYNYSISEGKYDIDKCFLLINNFKCGISRKDFISVLSDIKEFMDKIDEDYKFPKAIGEK